MTEELKAQRLADLADLINRVGPDDNKVIEFIYFHPDHMGDYEFQKLAETARRLKRMVNSARTE